MIRSLLCLLAGAGLAPAPRPRLVVVITVDQLRPDYLERYHSQLLGGFATLLKGGASFSEAYQDHAITETAPGHSTILSGRWPAHTGITRNLAGVQDQSAPLIGVTGLGASPTHFRGTAFFDWLKAADPGARALSVSGKDRGAILPIGRAKERVYWYVGGFFTTSRYYADSLPTWVRVFNGQRVPFRAAGTQWTLFLPERDYPEPDSVSYENQGRDVLFPHRLPMDSGQAALAFVATPFPERARALGHPGAVRVIPDTIFQRVNAALDQRVGGGDWLQFESGMLLRPDRAKLVDGGANADSVVADVATRLRALAGVARVDRPADLTDRNTADPVSRRWIQQLPPDAGVELVVTLKPYSIWSYPSVAIAMHGQPTDLDAHVPLILWGPGIRRGVYGGRVSTVDIAPTLARLLELTPAEPLDGRVLTEALGGQN